MHIRIPDTNKVVLRSVNTRSRNCVETLLANRRRCRVVAIHSVGDDFVNCINQLIFFNRIYRRIWNDMRYTPPRFRKSSFENTTTRRHKFDDTKKVYMLFPLLDHAASENQSTWTWSRSSARYRSGTEIPTEHTENYKTFTELYNKVNGTDFLNVYKEK